MAGSTAKVFISRAATGGSITMNIETDPRLLALKGKNCVNLELTPVSTILYRKDST